MLAGLAWGVVAPGCRQAGRQVVLPWGKRQTRQAAKAKANSLRSDSAAGSALKPPD